MSEVNNTDEVKSSLNLNKPDSSDNNSANNSSNSTNNTVNNITSSIDDNMLAVLSHVLGIFTGFIGPLIIFVISDNKPFVKEHSMESLNFQLTLLIGYIISSVLMVVCIGFLLLPVVWLCGIIFGIQAAMAANSKQSYRYPFNIRFIK